MTNKNLGTEKDIIFYNINNENIEVMVKNENVWLNSYAIAILFDVNRPAITKHINNIYIERELDKKSTCSKMEQVQKEGNREVKRDIEYMVKGFVLNDNRFMKASVNDKSHFKELLERIKLIRTDEWR